MTDLVKNDQGQISGAKLVLLLVGLVNRMSARGRFRLRLKDYEVETSDGRGHQD